MRISYGGSVLFIMGIVDQNELVQWEKDVSVSLPDE